MDALEGLRCDPTTFGETETFERDRIGAAIAFGARYVAPARSRATRRRPDVEGPRPFIDDMRGHEFPLSIYSVSLAPELAPSAPLPVAL